MKKLWILLLAAGMYSNAQAQGSPACQARFDSVNRNYDEQIAAFSNNPKVNAIDRDYRIVMLNFYRHSKLSEVESACTKGAGHRYSNCLEQANVINQAFNKELVEVRNNKRLSNQERMARTDQINSARNLKLQKTLEGCQPH